MNHYETKADLITMAKSLGGGFPISGVVGRAEVMDAPNPGGLGGTYAGSPIAVAAAHAVIDAIEEENLCDRANELGAELVTTLKDIQQATVDVVTDIRALGSMVAVELETAEQAKVVQTMQWKRVVTSYCGKYGNVIRFLYPLTIPAEQFRQGLDVLKEGFATLKAGSAKAMEQSA